MTSYIILVMYLVDLIIDLLNNSLCSNDFRCNGCDGVQYCLSFSFKVH